MTPKWQQQLHLLHFENNNIVLVCHVMMPMKKCKNGLTQFKLTCTKNRFYLTETSDTAQMETRTKSQTSLNNGLANQIPRFTCVSQTISLEQWQSSKDSCQEEKRVKPMFIVNMRCCLLNVPTTSLTTWHLPWHLRQFDEHLLTKHKKQTPMVTTWLCWVKSSIVNCPSLCCSIKIKVEHPVSQTTRSMVLTNVWPDLSHHLQRQSTTRTNKALPSDSTSTQINSDFW